MSYKARHIIVTRAAPSTAGRRSILEALQCRDGLLFHESGCKANSQRRFSPLVALQPCDGAFTQPLGDTHIVVFSSTKQNSQVLACLPRHWHRSLHWQVEYPIIADPSRDLAVRLGMLDPVAKDAAGLPLTARAVFVIGPDKKLKLSILYPATTGRNFHEVSDEG